MENWFTFDPTTATAAVVLAVLLLVLYINTHSFAVKDLWIVMANVVYLGHDLYRIEGMNGTFKLDNGLPITKGFGRWRSAFRHTQEYYGPIAFDDLNKSFVPINPEAVTVLNRISEIQKDIVAGTKKLPYTIVNYGRSL